MEEELFATSPARPFVLFLTPRGRACFPRKTRACDDRVRLAAASCKIGLEECDARRESRYAGSFRA